MKGEIISLVETGYEPRSKVIFIGSPNGTSGEPLLTVLKNIYHTDSYVFSEIPNTEDADFRRMNLIVEAGFVSCVIIHHRVQQEFLQRDLEKYKKLGWQCQLFILSEENADPISSDLLLKFDAKALQTAEDFRELRDTVESWSAPRNDFDVRDVLELDTTVEHLSQVGTHAHEECDTAVPVDLNTASVTQAIRMSRGPLVTRYGDYRNLITTLNSSEPEEQNVPTNLDAEIQRFAELKPEERNKIAQCVLEKVGYEKTDTGAIRMVTPSRGAGTAGFAIDLVTGFNRRYRGYGAHTLAYLEVSKHNQRVAKMERLLSTEKACEDDGTEVTPPMNSIYSGYITEGTEEFPGPFAIVTRVIEPETIKAQIADFIKTNYGAVPVDSHIRLLSS